MKVSQKKTTIGKQRSNSSKRKTVAEWESIESGKMQNNIWKLGKVQLKNDEENEACGRQQNRVWDTGRQRLKSHDQKIMIILTLGI